MLSGLTRLLTLKLDDERVKLLAAWHVYTDATIDREPDECDAFIAGWIARGVVEAHARGQDCGAPSCSHA